MYLFPDPPEIEIEQNWFRRSRGTVSDGTSGNGGFDGGDGDGDGDGDAGGDVIEVELICVVHAVPKAEVATTLSQTSGRVAK